MNNSQKTHSAVTASLLDFLCRVSIVVKYLCKIYFRISGDVSFLVLRILALNNFIRKVLDESKMIIIIINLLSVL